MADEPDGRAPLRIYDRSAFVRAGTRRDRQPRESSQPSSSRNACGQIARDSSKETERRRRAGSSRGAGAARGRQSIADADSLRRLDEQEYAATGMGRRTDHAVTEVWLDLEDTPAQTVNIRYEYRPQLVWLGILPAARRYPIRSSVESVRAASSRASAPKLGASGE